MATRERTDYLRFNAFAIKDLITRKLAQDSNFTDQIFPGSNLTILIDILSYMYQTLLYCLNSASAEALFSDTQIYENINRLCSFIGYHPAGMNPAYAVFSFSKSELLGQLNQQGVEVSTNSIVYIPRYSYLDTGLVDASGKTVYFSTAYDIEVESTTDQVDIVLYNGRWRMYDTVFTYTGSDWEKFILNGLRSDSSTGDYVANNGIHVYVAEPNGNGSYLNPTQYTVSNAGLFKSRNEFFNMNDVSNANSGDNMLIIPEIFKADSKVFDLRLNENKTYEITFGNGRQGYKPKSGSLIYVFYLESNGPGVEFGIGDLGYRKLEQDFTSFRRTNSSSNDKIQDVYKYILGLDFNSNINIFVTTGVPNVINVSQSMSFAPEESVDQIRDFAPSWFRMGNRLVTQADYEYYLKNSSAFRNTFADIKCQNNWEYMATFYKWLYQMGVKYKKLHPEDYKGSRRFLSQDNLLKTTRQYADPADANNVYIWFYPSNESDADIEDSSNWGAFFSKWKQALLPIKDLTHEPFFVPAIKVAFFVCACQDEELVSDQINKTQFFNIGLGSRAGENYIEITISDEVLYANASIAAQITGIIRQFFDSRNFTIGQYVNFNDLQDMIFAISGVEKIRTVYKPNADNYDNCVVRNGICFASYTTDTILDVNSKKSCLDLEVSSAGRSLEPFQFPVLVNPNNSPVKIKIIKHSAISINSVQY